MKTVEIVGVLGFILALLHICWQVRLHYRQNSERVRARVSLGSKPCIRVHNIGAVPVHLIGVELVIDGDGESKKYSLQSIHVHRSLSPEVGSLGQETWQFTGHRTYSEPLPRGGAYIFALSKEAAPLSDLLSKAEKLRMRISIISNAGEIHRIRKRDVLAYLAEVAHQDHAQLFGPNPGVGAWYVAG